jgi:hypothetical protein
MVDLMKFVNELINYFKAKTIHLLYIGATIIYLVKHEQINMDNSIFYGWLFISFWAASATTYIWQNLIIKSYKYCKNQYQIRQIEEKTLRIYDELQDCEKAVIDCCIANKYNSFQVPKTVIAGLGTPPRKEFRNFQRSLYAAIKKLEVQEFGKTEGEDYIIFNENIIDIINKNYGLKIHEDFFDKNDNENKYINGLKIFNRYG